MLDIVATSMTLHNLCIVNNEGIEEDWIIKVDNKLAAIVTKGELWEGSELQRKRAGLAEVQRKIVVIYDAPILDEVNNIEIYLQNFYIKT